MKKLWNVLVLTLAINFLALAGGAGWLYRAGHLDRQKIHAIKEMLFPPPLPSDVKLETASQPATQPSARLEELLARHTGRTASEQVEFIRHTFDAQMVQLDRRQRELDDLQNQVDLAREQMARDRAQLEQERQKLQNREQEATRLQTDQGFQDSLLLYQSMPPRQVKTIFMTLGDDVVIAYLQAMPPRLASRILKEFKSPEEIGRIQSVLEKMRQAQASSKEP